MPRIKPEQLGVETMRRLALAGLTHVSQRNYIRTLEASSFGSIYASNVELDDRAISRELDYSNILNTGKCSDKFYPTPFFKNGHFDVVLFRPHFFKGGAVSKIEIVQIGRIANYDKAIHPLKYYEIGFRFEKRGEADIHGYPHAQFTHDFLRNISLRNNGGSIEYPAIPIAESPPHSRMFAAFISFAGLDRSLTQGFMRYIGQLENTGGTTKDFEQFVAQVRKTCKYLFDLWNGTLFNRIKLWVGGRIGKLLRL